MEKFLQLINGKKTLIVGLLCVLVSYCQVKGWLGQDEVIAWQGIITVLGYSASLATPK